MNSSDTASVMGNTVLDPSILMTVFGGPEAGDRGEEERSPPENHALFYALCPFSLEFNLKVNLQ
jgi:hypothetical protein